MSYISFGSMSSCSEGIFLPSSAFPFQQQQHHHFHHQQLDGGSVSSLGSAASIPAVPHGWGSAAPFSGSGLQSESSSGGLQVPFSKAVLEQQQLEQIVKEDTMERAWQMFNRMAKRGGGLVPTPTEEAILHQLMMSADSGAAGGSYSCSSQAMRRRASQEDLVFQMEL